MNYKAIVLAISLSTQLYAEEPIQTTFLPCLQQPTLQAERSIELKAMLDADQQEREALQDLSQEEQLTLIKNDLTRRKRVGEIFGEGCFKTPADYTAAAMIYQHGDTPDHYYQAYLWASQAVKLGDESQKSLMADAIDRYLVSLGKKQLFGSQAKAENMKACFCIEPVETSFPDERRVEYTGHGLEEMYAWIGMVNEGKGCGAVVECETDLQASPKGSVLGFW